MKIFLIIIIFFSNIHKSFANNRKKEAQSAICQKLKELYILQHQRDAGSSFANFVSQHWHAFKTKIENNLFIPSTAFLQYQKLSKLIDLLIEQIENEKKIIYEILKIIYNCDASPELLYEQWLNDLNKISSEIKKNSIIAKIIHRFKRTEEKMTILKSIFQTQRLIYKILETKDNFCKIIPIMP